MIFSEIKAQIYPWIKLSLQDEPENEGVIHQQGEPGNKGVTYRIDLPKKPFLADLLIFFAVDMGDRFELLQTSHLPEDMTVDELYALAVNNLSEKVEYKLTSTNFGGYGLLAGGDHEAGALCLDYLWHFCAERIGESLIIAVPAKDMVLMVGQSQTEALAQMKQVSADILQTGDRTLTTHLFRYDAEKGEFSVFE